MEDLSLGRAAADPSVAARTALVADGVAYSFADLAARVAPLRATLAHEGVAPGSRVALIARNSVDTLLVLHALLDLGATLVPIHPRLTPAEASLLLADAAPTLTLRDGDLRTTTSSSPLPLLSGPASPIQLPATSNGPGLGEGGGGGEVCGSLSFPLALVYTSGTSGRPKGALLSRRAFSAAACASAKNLGWTDDDRWLLVMPVCHVGGLSIVTRCLAARRAVILEPSFDPDAVLASVVQGRATLLSVVPTMLQALLEHDRDNALARLRAILVGGAGAPFALLEECARRGVPALTTYGLTEACSQVTVQRPPAAPDAIRGSGHPLPGVEIRIDVDDRAAPVPGAVGRILVRGPTLMDGYFRGDGHAPDPARDAGGFFDTGDLGEVDAAGALHVHARRSDLVVTGGENVYPVEVEQRLEALPGVRRALVFGVPDARWGQRVAAALELAPGTSLAALGPSITAALAPHKRPRLVCVVDALPLTGSGKLDRAGVAERYAAALRPATTPS